MNIFLHELKSYRKSTIIWSLSLIIMVLFFLSMFPSISKDAEEFKKLLEGYPVAVRKAIGLEMDSFFTLVGFYSYSFLYISLCGAIQAMNLGTSIISKETREKTADFLLTKPVTRINIITAKLLAVLFSLIITNITFILGSSIMASQVANDDYNSKVFFMISITLFFIQLIFLALGFFISVVVPKIKSVLSVSLSTVFTFFIIAMISSVSGDDAKRYLSPFKYFDYNYITKHESFEASFIIFGGGIFIASIVATYIIYVKKDIHSV